MTADLKDASGQLSSASEPVSDAVAALGHKDGIGDRNLQTITLVKTSATHPFSALEELFCDLSVLIYVNFNN